MDKYFDHISFQKVWNLNENSIFQLGKCRAYIKAISNTPIRPDYRKELNSISLIKGAKATTAIEGNTLTFDQILAIHKGQTKIPPSKEYLKIEVENIIDAMNGIQESVLKNQKISLITPELIKNFHKLVGRNLGEHFQAIPGKFRQESVTVGNYLAPPYENVKELIPNLCDWLRREFNFENGQKFSDSIVQAIVTHVYIAWIHPFSDGNGRTARLLEYYLLLRAGVPDIASHVLSNHYNETRAEYYRQLENATKEQKLTGFIQYAIQGFLDGLEEILNLIQENQCKITWRNYISGLFEGKKLVGSAAVAHKRRRSLALALPTDSFVTPEEIPLLNQKLNQEYSNTSARTIERDITELMKMGIVIEENDAFRGKIELLSVFMALSLEK